MLDWTTTVQQWRDLLHPGKGQEDFRDAHSPAQWNLTCVQLFPAGTLPGVELKTVRPGGIHRDSNANDDDDDDDMFCKQSLWMMR